MKRALPAVILLTLILTGAKPMTVKQEEWIQREWTNPGVNLYRSRGDFYNLSALLPDSHGHLKRAPAWSSHVDLPAGIVDIQGAFWDEANDRYVLIGSDPPSPTTTKVVLAYYSSSWSASSVTDLITATTALGGKHMHNVAYWGGDLYVIGADSKVYRGSTYTSTLSEFYATTNAHLLAPCGDRMYLITTAGKVLRLNDADNAFETHYDPIAALEVLYATAFRGYLALFTRGDDGTLYIYRLPDRSTETPVTMHQIATVPFSSGDLPANGSLFAVHDDAVYFTPGRVARPHSTSIINVYRFNGSQVERAAQLWNTPTSPEVLGLINYRHHLLYYALTEGGDQTVKAMVGQHFVDFTNLKPPTSSGYIPLIASMNGNLIITHHDTTDGEGIHHATASSLADGYVQTSRLDMGHPSREKLLHRITVILDSAATDFKIVIRYRTDDNTNWTTATTATTTRRATADVRVSFYTLQLRIELDDDSVAGDNDIRINAISALYTISN